MSGDQGGLPESVSDFASGTEPSEFPRIAARASRSLTLRLAMLLSMALLPLGLIAVWQTTRIERELAETNARDLTALTAEVARQERETIQSALGAAEALSAMMVELSADPQRCRKVLRSFLDQANGRFAFAGFLPVSGTMDCSTLDGTMDVGDTASFLELVADGTQAVTLAAGGLFTAQPELIASTPVRDANGVLTGFLSVSIPHYRVSSPYSEIIGGRQMDLFTINRDGDVLTASGDIDTAVMRLPADRRPDEMIGGPDRFITRNGLGERQVYSIVPIVEDTVYAVGAWQPVRNVDTGPLMRLLKSPALFPIIMWLASLALVYLAVERLVVRHVRSLAGKMRQFGRTRALPQTAMPGQMPDEIAVIDREFAALADRLLHEEAELLDAMHTKDVLLKEVHHRVKNNLQLISSIVNMQARRTATPATATALESVNRRVISMATVHRRLYQAENLGRVRADEVLRDVVSPLADLAQPGRTRSRMELRLDPVVLYPDQAVPAALLTVEAVTNALKYLGTDTNGERWLRVTLQDLGEGLLKLSIASSVGADSAEPTAEESSGLGSQLINAFARQLDARVEVEETATRYVLRLTFQAAAFAPDPTG